MFSNDKFPDFSTYGYQVLEELGQNHTGGRTTYKALVSETNCLVVIKQFAFSSGGNWTGYKAFEREIQILQSLNHPGIPRYLDAFETTDGFCLVQEYVPAVTLATRGQHSAESVKQIATKALLILSYLQTQAVIHRDLKPENILIDEEDRIYFIDFGFAKKGSGESLAASSVVVGTTGFMPPEAIFGRPLGNSSDLYSLGATLICLLSGVSSAELSNYVDFKTFKLDTTELLPFQLQPSFRWWLEKVTNPDPRDRFPDATAALEALKEGKIEPVEDVTLKPVSNWGLAKAVAVVALSGTLTLGAIGALGFAGYEMYQSLETASTKISQSILVKQLPKTSVPKAKKAQPQSSDSQLDDAVKMILKDINFAGLLLLPLNFLAGIWGVRRKMPLSQCVAPFMFSLMFLTSLNVASKLILGGDSPISTMIQTKPTDVAPSTLTLPPSNK